VSRRATVSQPKTFDEAVQWVIDQFNAEDLIGVKAMLKTQTPESVAGIGHHGFGTFVRNELHLWHPPSEELRQSIWDTLTPEKQEFYRNWWVGKGEHQGRTMHADDASHVVITAAVKKIQDEPVLAERLQ
jgi:hypothetical protein